MCSVHLNYVLLTENSNLPDLVPLLEGLIKKAGYWTTKQVVANLEIKSELFPFFRQVGFSVLAKQRIYQCAHPQKTPIQNKGKWRIWNRGDIGAMRSLYLTLVPPLIQPVEPLSRREMLGLVYYDDEGILQAYADLVYGPVGAWVLPLIHPKTKDDISDLLLQMVLNLPDLNHRQRLCRRTFLSTLGGKCFGKFTHGSEPGTGDIGSLFNHTPTGSCGIFLCWYREW
jgi:hypothetical protein